jgi:branched-chain amino acid transport system ATP-binding protein
MPLLEVNNLSKRFGGLLALDNCSFVVEDGSICSIIGPNGAGKTTAFNLISGIIPPTTGSIVFNSTFLSDLKVHQITKLGIGRTFQNIHLFKEVTVLENVKIGQHCRTKAGIFPSLLRLKSQRDEEKNILKISNRYLDFVGLETHKNELAVNLPYGDQKRLEIARALTTEPSLLMLDEPNSGMNTQETLELVELLKKIKAFGVTILVISHHMKFVQDISDHVIVLNYGRIIAEGKPDEVIRDEQVIQAYLGKA